jgi:hypothetical protein
MAIDPEVEARRLLNDYKWGEDFICHACSNTSYKPRRNFGRECKKCGEEETAYKYTALEQCRIPAAKVVLILRYLVDTIHIDYDKKVIPIKLKVNGKGFHENKPDKVENEISHMEGMDTDEGIFISLNELRSMRLAGDLPPETENVLFENYIMESRLIQADLAKRYEVNGNSLRLLLDKIAKRISFFFNEDRGSETLEIINSFFGEGRFDLNYVFGMLMVPIDDTWQRNEKNVDGKWFHIVPPSKQEPDKIRWETRNFAFFRKDADGNYRNYYNKEDEP